MANLCGHCRRLATDPTRIDIPEHLRRKLSEGPPGSLVTTGQHLAIFACLDCSANWQWSTAKGWTQIRKVPPALRWLARLGIPGFAKPSRATGRSRSGLGSRM